MFTDRAIVDECVARAVARLVSARSLSPETALISLPVSYPNGTLASVQVSVSGSRCFVSDCAIGYREAELAGVADFYDHIAQEIAGARGIGYDGASVFAANTQIDRIAGAAIAVANASVAAVSRSLYRAAEVKERSKNNTLFDIVSDVFGRQNVTKHMEIAGRDAVWDAHNVVSLSGHLSIFEFVNDHPNSIASKFLMFSDITGMDAPPDLISVVNSVENLGPKGAMLGNVSNVIQLNADRSIYRRFAKVAA